MYALGNMYGYAGENAWQDAGKYHSITASSGGVVLQSPTIEVSNAPASRATLSQGLVSVTSSARVDLSVLDSSSAPVSRLLLGGTDSSALLAYANSIASIYGGTSIVGVAGGGTVSGLVSFGATSVFQGSTSLAVMSTSDQLGTLSMSSSAVYMGGTAACTGSGAALGSGGTGYSCGTGGGQVRVPYSGLVLSSRLYVSCASTSTPSLDITALLSAHVIIISKNCPSGTVVLLPDLSQGINTEGWTGIVIYDMKSGSAPYLSSPTQDYILLQYFAASGDLNALYSKVSARTAVTLIAYNSDWSGGAGSAGFPTYAVVGAIDRSLSTNPWYYG